VDKARAREGPAYSHLRKEKCTISLWKLDKRNGRNHEEIRQAGQA
jgi:hypothetical protein